MMLQIAKHVFRPDWKTTVLTLLLLPLLLALSHWQFDREAEKIQILHDYEQRINGLAVRLEPNWSALIASNDSNFTRVTFTAKPITKNIVLLDNKVQRGIVGFEILQEMQLVLDEESTQPPLFVWVNRGWVAGPRLRTDAPQVPLMQGEKTIQAHIYQPLGKAFLLSDELQTMGQDHWPLLQGLDMGTLQSLSMGGAGLKSKIFPYLLRLEFSSPMSLSVDWPAVNMQPEKHRGYAIQWLLMAIVLVIIYFFRSTEKINE